MVGGIHTHLDDMLTSQQQSTDWTQHTTSPSSISDGGTFWLLVPCVRKLHSRPALTWTAVLNLIKSHQQTLGNHTNELTSVGFKLSTSVVKLFHLTT